MWYVCVVYNGCAHTCVLGMVYMCSVCVVYECVFYMYVVYVWYVYVRGVYTQFWQKKKQRKAELVVMFGNVKNAILT